MIFKLFCHAWAPNKNQAFLISLEESFLCLFRNFKISLDKISNLSGGKSLKYILAPKIKSGKIICQS